MRSRTPLPQRQQAHWGAFLEAAALFLALCVLGRSAALTLAAVVAAPFPAVQTALWWGQRNLQSETSDPEPEPAVEEQAPPASSAVPEAVQALTGGIEDYLVALQPEDARPADAGAVIEKQYPQGSGEKYIPCGAGSIKNNTRQTAADLAADLLQETDPAKAEELARQLCDLNRERQAVEQAICADAIAQIEKLRPEDRNALVLSSEEWHQGVVGIVASRLSEKYAAPSFMIHLKDGSGKGSCRSYGGFNLFAALESCADLLDGFGGHELAAGFTIPEENIAAFRQRMNRCVKAASGGERAVSCLEVDAAISNPADMTLEQVDQLSQLEPYGAGNPRPVFALLGATVDSVQSVGQGKHLKLRLSKGPSRFDAIFFSMPEAEAHLEPGCRVDAAFYLQANTFRGNTTLQLQLVDLRPSLTPSRHEAESLALLHRLTEGGHLTAQETARLMISRDQFAAFWRVLEWHLKQGKLETELLPYLRTLAAQAGGCDSFLRAGLALTVFQERGLISLTLQDERLTLCLNPVQGKVDLNASPYLLRLRGGAETK